jgi:hypothetical protein
MSRFKKWIKNIIKKGNSEISITDPESLAEYYNQISLHNPFRLLTGKESEAVAVFDNREFFNAKRVPNN